MRDKSLIALLFFFQFIATEFYPAYSQRPDYKFKHITETDGLPSLNIQSMLRDSKGFMWIGSEGGLFKYDGFSIKVFQSSTTDTFSILGNYIRTIAEDKNSDLWIGTTSGLCKYNRALDNFTHYHPNPKNRESINSNLIFSIAQDKNQNLWIATNDSGLNYMDVKTQKFKHFKHDSSNQNSLADNVLTKVFIDKKGRVWVGTISGTVDLLMDKKGEFKHFQLPTYNNQGFNRDQIRDIIEDNDGNIWIGTSGSGIFKIHETENTYQISQYCQHKIDPIEISNDYVSCLELDKSGNLLVGTENGGINYIDFKLNKTHHFVSDVFNNNTLTTNSIWDLHIDSDSNLWVSCYSKGIDVYLNKKFGFNHFKNIPNNSTSLAYNTVSCFYEDSKGNLWVGTDGGGLDLFDKKNGTFRHFTTKNSGIPSNAVLSIYEDSKGVLWIGTWSGGLSTFDYETGQFNTYSTQNSNLSCNNIISITELKSGELLAGTFWCEGGLNIFDRSAKRFTSFTTKNSMIYDNVIFCILEDYSGLIWLGTNNGLTTYNRSTNSFQTYISIDKDSSSISQNTVMSIIESRDSTIWIATLNGLNKYLRKSNSFQRFYTVDGLPNNYIAGLEEDNHGNIWISTQDGISKFNPSAGTFINYSVSFGLQGKQFYRCSHYKDKEGTIYFGGTNGFNMFNPNDIKDNFYKAPVYFTGLNIFNVPATIGLKNSPLTKHISEANEVKLNYNQNSISFEFTAINYRSPDETWFAYKLEGVDNNWIYCGNQRSAFYTNLDPGEYIFRVKIQPNCGIVNEEGISIKVLIKPPFWQLWWFRVIVTLSLIIGVVGFYLYRISAVNIRNKQLSLIIEERTRELQEKNILLREQAEELNETNTILEERQQLIEENTEELMAQKEELENSNSLLQEVNATKDKFFSIIAHDIKNPFNAIIGFSDLLKLKYDEWSDEKRKHIIDLLSQTSENVYELLENLLQWSRSQRGVIEFRPKNLMLKTALENIVSTQSQNAVAKNIEIVSSIDDESMEIFADPTMFDSILRNLISNAIKFTNTNGKIIITARKTENDIIIEVSDNGVGMSKETVNHLFRIDTNFSTPGTNKEKGTGLGLILVKEFIGLHNGTIEVISERGIGSTFTLRFPVDSNK